MSSTGHGNAHRQRAIASLLTRHTRVTAPDGTCVGCLCGAPMTRFEHTKHLAQLVDALVEAALDVAFANHAKDRSA